MSLKTAINSAVVAAFSAMGELETAITFVKKTSNPTYETSTGVVTSASVSVSFNAMLVAYDRREIDGNNILSTDSKIIFPQSRLSYTPTTSDTITISSINWEIKEVSQDPANATWTIQIRRA